MALPRTIRLLPTGDPNSETIQCDRCGFRLTLEEGVSVVWPDEGGDELEPREGAD